MNYDIPQYYAFQQPIISIVQEVKQEPEKPKPEPVRYTVKRGDSLTKIAREYNTSVLRLFYKNKAIRHPDKLKVGLKLVIPAKDEKLKKRKVPAIIRNAVTTRSLDTSSPRISGGYSSSGNLYDYHSCTWWVKYNRPNIPNNWGDATNWLANARAQGYATGSTPRAGAVGWKYGHVVYVISVSGSSITIGDGNYDWHGSYRVRQANASEFTYIY